MESHLGEISLWNRFSLEKCAKTAFSPKFATFFGEHESERERESERVSFANTSIYFVNVIYNMVRAHTHQPPPEYVCILREMFHLLVHRNTIRLQPFYNLFIHKIYPFHRLNSLLKCLFNPSIHEYIEN